MPRRCVPPSPAICAADAPRKDTGRVHQEEIGTGDVGRHRALGSHDSAWPRADDPATGAQRSPLPRSRARARVRSGCVGRRSLRKLSWRPSSASGLRETGADARRAGTSPRLSATRIRRARSSSSRWPSPACASTARTRGPARAGRLPGLLDRQPRRSRPRGVPRPGAGSVGSLRLAQRLLTSLGSSDALSPLAFPASRLSVADLLL